MRAGAPAGQGQPNTIALAVFEVLAYGLRKEGRITPATIASTMEVSQFWAYFRTLTDVPAGNYVF